MTTSRTPPAALPTRLPSLTGLRFLAALLVVCYHLSRQVGALPVLSPLAWYGRSGVTFFFVLSGFVLAWTYADAPVPARRFYRRRLARIWPLHALTTGASLAVYAALGAAVPVTAALWSLPLLHPWGRATVMGGNPAGWSLGDEAWFYLLFPLLLRLRPGPRAAALCCACGPLLWLAGSAVADPALRGWLLDYLPLSRTPQFLLGAALALAVRRGRLPVLPPLPAALAVAAFHLALVPWHHAVPDAAWYGPYSASQLLSAPLFAALITATAQADLRRPAGPLARRPWTLLGDWSFAWYLVHEITFRPWLHRYGHPAPGLPTATAWLLLATASLALAAALHHLVEHPLERRLRDRPAPTRLIRPRTAPDLAAAPPRRTPGP
ncbi:acyltransferase family protein [Kitasatospora phosalacinea]|uniref:acyltransferase family protein n=1 Tax=Kitasatospora phosalacinea TaxID=2065 RepID=UPI00068BF9E2|nr:acyltransferase [Kitasatospora phosalacinea]